MSGSREAGRLSLDGVQEAITRLLDRLGKRPGAGDGPGAILEWALLQSSLKTTLCSRFRFENPALRARLEEVPALKSPSEEVAS
jgi:hypothetical protein